MGLTRMDALEVKDGGRKRNYPGSSMAYPPEGSDWKEIPKDEPVGLKMSIR
jgi:hypothetical protein